ncbi:MAG: hypothetical protein IJZ72_02425, partial [Oscillospiraceae bacterium]|nr:hypothetical protein [Oscillospiraceae bacterium]
HPPKEEITDEDELDFSGIDTSRKHPPKEEITDEDELDFSGIDTSRKHPPKEEITDEDELDFSGIDTSRKHPPKEEITDEDELDFSDVDTSYHPADDDVHEKSEDSPVFDFSGVNDKYDESDEKRRIISLRIRLTERLRKIAVNGTLSQWKDFFERTHFEELAGDFVFRTNAAKLLNGRAFPKDIALLIAENFGNGTTVSRLSVFSGLYQIFIPIGTQPSEKKYTPKKPSLFMVIAATICVFMAVPLIMILSDSNSSYKNNPISSDNPYVDEKYTMEELYKECVGRWDFSFGHIEFFEANFFEMDYRGEIYRGEVICTDADDDILSVTLRAPDTEINGFSGSVKLFYMKRKSMVIKDNNGKIFMGNYVYDENEVTE